MKNILLFASVLIILFAPDLKSQWFIQNSGNANNFSALWAVDANTAYATTQYALYKTSNGGASWFVNLSYSAYFDDVEFVNPNTGYCIGRASGGSHLFKTTNAGTGWFVISNIPVLYKCSLSFLNATTGAVATFGGVYQTTDGGLTWFNNQGGPDYFTDVAYVSPDSIWVTTDVGNLERSVTGGALWQGVGISYGSPQHGCFFLNNNTGWVVTSNGGVYKSTTAGWIPWVNHPVGIAGCELDGVYFYDEMTGWVCGCNGSIHGTTDGGLTWTQQSIGTTSKLVDIKFVNALTGWAVGESGRILNTTNGGVSPNGIEPVSNELPDKFQLSQNYPNPFNPTTKIKFDIAFAGPVKISVFDVLGREISVPLNEILNPGKYEINFDGSDIPSGIYYYRITINSSDKSLTHNFTDTKKMVLLK